MGDSLLNDIDRKTGGDVPVTQAPRRIGLLGPFAELPGEFVDVVAESPEPAVVWQVVTEAADSHDPEDLRRTGSQEVLVRGTQRLLRWSPDVIMWACTSGSFIYGRQGCTAQSENLAKISKVPVSSTSLAFVDALLALNATEVNVLAPYPPEAAEALAAFLREWGIDVGEMVHLDYPNGRSSETLELPEIEAHLRHFGTERLVLIPDTAVWGFCLLTQLEKASLPTNVLVANQVTLWQAFRLAGMSTDVPAFRNLRGRG